MRTVTLSPSEGLHDSRRLYRLRKGWRVRFLVSAGLHQRGARLLTTHPAEGDAPAQETFRQLTLRPSDDVGWQADLLLARSGPWQYRLDLHGKEGAGSGFFQVEPSLGVEGGLDGVACLTLLPKLLGPFAGWEAKLRVAKETGYNMIHFAPLQELGSSGSSYSIADQLRLNPALFEDPEDFGPLADLTEKLRSLWGLRSIADVVFNHTAHNSHWLLKNPSAGYNLVNSPHLRPAFLLDAALGDFGAKIATGAFEEEGLPPIIETQTHLDVLKSLLEASVIPALGLEKLFQVGVAGLVQEFDEEDGDPSEDSDALLLIIQDPAYRPLRSTVDMGIARRIHGEDSAGLRRHLEHLNALAAEEAASHMAAAVKALIAHVHYHRVADWGPQVREVSETHPVFPRYFVRLGEPKSGAVAEWAYGEAGAFVLACNGWVMGDDPLRNFAELPSQVYLRRELVSWGDCVKLRYGREPSDSPQLWRRMEDYVKGLAGVFDGFRLDNCHSTPMHVAAHLLAVARRVRPELYVVAELFTADEGLDNVFVNRLGISSCVREAQNADSSHEAGRLVLRYGTASLGSFLPDAVEAAAARSGVAHAAFTDLTHDNPSFFQKRTGQDSLPAAALVCFTASACGSTAGFDQLLTQHVNVVSETRLYPDWLPDKAAQAGFVGPSSGLFAAKAALNRLHREMAAEGYEQTYVDDRSPTVVAVTRERPTDHSRYLLVAHTAISSPDTHHRPPPITVQGRIDAVTLEAELVATEDEDAESPEFLTGTRTLKLKMAEGVKVSESAFVTAEEHGDSVTLHFNHFPPSAVIVLKLSCTGVMQESLAAVRTALAEFPCIAGDKAKAPKEDALGPIVAGLDWAGLHYALFRCEAEESCESGGVYEVPNYGKLLCAGLLGLRPLLRKIRREQDLGHPLCDNLRQGTWLLLTIAGRLRRAETAKLGLWFDRRWSAVEGLPSYLRPAYFEAVIRGVTDALLQALEARLPKVLQQSRLSCDLAVAASAFCSRLSGADLPPLAPSLSLPLISISAGFPHFASGIFRNWGRDTCIALPGCLLVTGRFEEAKAVLLSLAGTLRHGLIPNLIGEGKSARYNCRDAVWFWLYAVREYVRLAPEGAAILQSPVMRMYPLDETVAGRGDEKEEPLGSTIQEALSRHWHGLDFRERNAGPGIDMHMKDPGFQRSRLDSMTTQVTVSVCRTTGLVSGGNSSNCGTWMDKMGGSEAAGNKGVPATPRDGAAVELQGLAHAVLDWLADEKAFPFKAVLGGAISYAEWRDLIAGSFRSCFWVPGEGESTDGLRLNPALVNRRGMVKDSFGASAEFADYQLRPNFAIALAVAPELLPKEEAWQALETANEALNGPHIGLKTLDPSDWAYRPYYDNANQSTDFAIAQGLNYHQNSALVLVAEELVGEEALEPQGPEWVWVKGFFLRARLAAAKRLGDAAVKAQLAEELQLVRATLDESAWESLPELTNKDGEACPHSCPAQAWSVALFLELQRDLQEA